MFSENELVKVRKSIESLYSGRCDIIEHQKVKKENKSTGFEDVVVLENQPCRLSIKNINNTSPHGNGASAVVQSVKLFVSPDIVIKPGSKIIVTQNNVTTEYKNSGQPAFYSTHQEITLELFKGWA